MVAVTASVGLWAIFTFSAVTGGGLHGPGYMGYAVAILVTGIAINWRAALIMTVISMAMGLYIVYGVSNGLIFMRSYTPLESWGAISIYFAVIAAISRQTVQDLLNTRIFLRNREKQYRSLVENSPDFIIRLDGNMRYVYVNPAVGLASGLPSQAYIGKTNQELGIGLEQVQAWEAETRQVFKTGKEKTIEFIYPVLNAGKRQFQARLTPEIGEDGKIETVLSVVRDVTDFKKAERLQLEIEQERELLELKQRFIETASHDFRTPLSIIQSSAGLLENYHDRMSPERRLSKLQQIQSQVDRMARMLDRILIISKSNAGKIALSLAELDLKLFCTRIWEDVIGIDKHSHEMIFNYQATISKITADERLLQYVLINLLSNAIKYSAPDQPVEFKVTNNEEGVEFSVQDKGLGIPAADLDYLFEPFHRASNVKNIDGTGLGLLIAKNYVELHEGTIEVESEEGVGSTFIVRLPITDTPINQPPPP